MKYSALEIESIAALKDLPRPPQWRRGLLLISCAASLVCLAFSQAAGALNPPPDGGYPNQNTAEGDGSLNDINTSADSDNTALGFEAMNLAEQVTGNTAVGSQALFFAFQANFNTGVGYNALRQVGGHGDNNTAVGASAAGINTTGSDNTAIGNSALAVNGQGNSNACLGSKALANVQGSSNIGIGESAGFNLTTGKNNIDIGNAGSAGESAKIRIGNKAHKNTFIAGINGVTVARGVGVVIDNNGQLGTVTSSARYKEAIKPMAKSSEGILNLKPVTFRYKKELDPEGIPQFGLVAEDVAQVDPALVARDEDGKPYTVRYEAVNAMLLNEFLKEHRKVEAQATKGQEQAATITKLESAVAQQQNEIKALTAAMKAQATQIQKVSDQLEFSKSTPHVVANNK